VRGSKSGKQGNANDVFAGTSGQDSG
jgi:hypothetical protein